MTRYNGVMNDIRNWAGQHTSRRITADDVAAALHVSRPTATRKLLAGLEAGEVIAVCRSYQLPVMEALIDMGHLTIPEVHAFLSEGAKLLGDAEDGELALELARRLNPATKAPEIDELAARRTPPMSTLHDHDGTVTDWDDTETYAADSSPREEATPDDYIP